MCGTKGLAAFKAIIDNSFFVSSVAVMPDLGVLNDPFEELKNLAISNGIPLNPTGSKMSAPNALAVGWKKLITANYENLYVIHDSLLPKYRGWNPLVSALQNRDSSTGVSLIRADDQMDHGPIIKQVQIPLNYPIRVREAMLLVEKEIFNLTLDLFKSLETKTVKYTNQDERSATFSIWRDEDDYKIDWNMSAERICNFIDSVSFPYQSALSFIKDMRIRIAKAEVVEDIKVINRVPGKTWRLDGEFPIVLCGEGSIKILEMYLDGGYEQKLTLQSVRSRFT